MIKKARKDLDKLMQRRGANMKAKADLEDDLKVYKYQKELLDGIKEERTPLVDKLPPDSAFCQHYKF